MNRAIFGRLVWKEFRLLRSFWIAMAILAVFASLYALVAIGAQDAAFRINALFAIALTIPALYALGCGATMFATEHEAGTYEFQRALPVSARQLLWGKLAFAVLSIPVLIGLLWLLAVWFAGGRLPAAGHHAAIWGLWGFAAVEALAWGMLFSLTSNHPLKAAMLGAAATSLAVHGVTATTQSYTAYPVYEDYAGALPYRVAIVVAVALVDAWLASRWLGEKKTASAPSAPKGTLAKALRPARDEDRLGGPSRETAFARLLWHQARQSAGALCVLGAMVAPWLAVSLVRSSVGRWMGADFDFLYGLTAILALAAVPLAGTCVFLADQRKGSIRFLAERGVRSGPVWWSRQLVFGAALALATMFALAVLGLDVLLRSKVEGEKILAAVGLLLGAVALGYSSGQLFSMFMRNALLGGFLSIVLTAILFAWAGLMWALGITWLWSAAPIPLVFLMATRLRAKPWMLGGTGLRGWLAPGLLLAGSGAALVAAVAAYRAYELPRVDPGFSPEQFAASSPEAQETARMYRRAYDLYVHLDAPKTAGEGTDASVEESEEDGRAQIGAWLEANREALALTLEATRRESCDAFPHGAMIGRWLERARNLGSLVIASGQALQRDDKLDVALERYLAALRLANHFRQRTELPWDADLVERKAREMLLAWAGDSRQTPQLLGKALDEFTQVASQLPSRTDAHKCGYLRLAPVLSGGLEEWIDQFGARREGRLLLWSMVALQMLPWERERARRALNLVTNQELSMLREYEEKIRRGEPLPDRPWRWDPKPPERWLLSTPIGQHYWRRAPSDIGAIMSIETERRALRLQLALAAWKLEHGELPESLDALVGPYLDALPIDPYAGEPFRYFPKGLPAPITRDTGTPERRETEIVVEAGRPFVWSVGPAVVVDRRRKDPRDRYVYDSDRRHRLRAHTEQEVWQWGRVFPVP